MFIQLRLLTITLGNGALLLSMLCLGGQNLSDKVSLTLVASNTVPLPSGFVVGAALVVGVVSGGSTAAVLLESRRP